MSTIQIFDTYLQSQQAIHVRMLKAAQTAWTQNGWAAKTGQTQIPLSGDPNYVFTGIDSSWPADVQFAATHAATYGS